MKQRNLLLIGLLIIPILAFGQRREVEGMKYLDENRKPIYRQNVFIPNVGEFQVLSRK